MILENAMQVALGGILAILILDRVFAFLNKRRNNNKVRKPEICLPFEILEDIKATKRLTHDLWEWHNVTDENEVRKWYMPRSISTDLEVLKEKCDKIDHTLEKLVEKIDEK